MRITKEIWTQEQLDDLELSVKLGDMNGVWRSDDDGLPFVKPKEKEEKKEEKK